MVHIHVVTFESRIMIMAVENAKAEVTDLPNEENEKQDIVKQVRTLLSTITSASKEATTSL